MIHRQSLTCMSCFEFWTKWKGTAARSLRKRGVAGTLRLAAAAATRRVWNQVVWWYLDNPCHRYFDGRFDQRFMVDTAGVLRIPTLHSNPEMNVHSPFKGYSPTPRSMFDGMLRRIRVDYSNFVFIDFGCGKGKVLLLARGMPFKRIIGVELSSELIRVAENNLKNYRGECRCNSVQLACMDVREFTLPDEPAVCYFYDPFEPEVLRTTLKSIEASFAASPRDIYVVYAYPVYRAVLDEAGFLAPVKRTRRYAIYKASGPNSKRGMPTPE